LDVVTQIPLSFRLPDAKLRRQIPATNRQQPLLDAVHLSLRGTDRHHADEVLGETAAVVIMALTLSFLATLYPSWRAARLDPVDALRYG
jgi:ABC-type lipoprotein release transport system permease subunit